MKNREEMTRELWCRVYASSIGRNDNRREAYEEANQALLDFDDRFPNEGLPNKNIIEL